MATFVLAMVGAVGPVLLMLRFVHVRDRQDRLPVRLVLKLWVIGFLTVLPALVLEGVGAALLLVVEPPGLLKVALIAAGIGLVEETSKFWVLRRLALPRTGGMKVYDGVIAGAAVGLGFAAVENVGYVMGGWLAGQLLLIIVVRALFAVPAHGLLGVMMGYYTSRAERAAGPAERRRLLRTGLLLPAVVHAAYDFCALAILLKAGGQAWAPVYVLGVLAVVAVIWVIGMRLIGRAQGPRPAAAPSVSARPAALPPLAPLTWRAPAAARFCTQCGVPTVRGDVLCGACSGAWARPVSREMPRPSAAAGTIVGDTPDPARPSRHAGMDTGHPSLPTSRGPIPAIDGGAVSWS